MNHKNEFQQMLDKWGVDAQIDMCIEEMAELTKALCKYKRGKKFSQYHEGKSDEYFNAVREEIADVLNCVNQMAMIFGEEEICKICDEKVKRTMKKLASS